MVKPFLKLIAEHVHAHYKDNVEKLCIILPNKRGSLFLKHYLGQTFGKTIWLPVIISAEDLIAELSGLKCIDEIDLMCHLYESYKTCYGPKAEPFDSFAKWGQLILQDFNEIDRYLADSEQLYENLKDIKVIENWSLGEENLSEFQINYLEFMNSLGAIYKHFSAFLLTNQWAYQGLAYKEAVNHLKKSIYPDQFEKILFCGFNALNAAELKIFNYLYTQKKAEILWDTDEYYLNNHDHEAGHFLRKNFSIFQQKEPPFIEKNFLNKKNIEIISVPKQIGQAQVVKQTVQKYIDQGIPLDKVAIVLANEKLLWPVLQQLPEQVEYVNVTMEYPLRYTSSYALIDSLLQIQLNYFKQNKKQKHLYYKDLTALLKQPLFNTFLKANKCNADINQTINSIVKKNISFITRKHLIDLFAGESELILPLLYESENIQTLCKTLLQCLTSLQDHFSNDRSSNLASLELEYLEIFINNLNRLSEVLRKYEHFNDIRSFKQLFNQVVGNSTAPFIGEPLKGLQIMGVLETRTLDFEHLILINVNEAVLPSGKSINSFIPNDLKRAFGLPLYLEKDAIYSYHFYRLLQRAEDITITYDSETDTFGKGEKSRFITQLQLELTRYSGSVEITEKAASANALPAGFKNNINVQKNEKTLELIRKKAFSNEQFSGLSPSSFIVFSDCSLKFYFRYGGGLKGIKEVEESAEANTFGSILHLSLENIYKDLIGKNVGHSDIKQKSNLTEVTVKKAFKENFDTDDLSGKTLLQYEVIKVYVDKLIKSDADWALQLDKQKLTLNIKELEKEFSAQINANINGELKTIYIKGKADRIDQFGQTIRVIDYKNSIKSADKFTFTNFENLFTRSDYNKQFQLIMYALLLHKNNYCLPEHILPGIIPFKEFKNKPQYLYTKNKELLKFTNEFLNEFESHLITFIESIFNPEHPFEQTGDKKICEYCDYNIICNKGN